MAYIGNPPAPQNITSSEITDGTIVNVDIASDAAIAATKIAGLSTVATTGAYSDVTGTPTLATVATTGAYADVTGTPTIPAAGTDFVAQTGGTFTGDVSFGDNDKAIFGAGSDLQIYHDGGNSFVTDAGVGYLNLLGTGLVRIGHPSNGETYINAYGGGDVELFFANSKKLSTTSTGIDVTGNATFADNGKAIFGAGSDLQIYHTGSQSFITDAGTGGIRILADADVVIGNADNSERYADFNVNGAVNLRYDNATKFSTVASGVNIIGEITADSYNETYSALSGTSPTVNCETGNSFSLTLSGNTTFTFSNPPASGTSYTFSIEIIQDASASGFTVTWPSSVDWPAATAPTLTATASAKDIFVFTTRDGGNTFYGFTAGQALA